MEFCEAVPDRGSDPAGYDVSRGICLFAASLYGKKVRTDVLACPSGFSEQHGCGYILIYEFGLVDSNAALIFVLAGGSAYNIWLLKSYMDGLPKELDEAAMVDGATHFQVFRKIILPLAAPQLAVIFLFSFIATYSEYVITSIFLQTPGKMTLALGLQTFISDQFAAHWTTFSAAAVLSSIPIMIVFMCLQKYIQSGLVSGGVKG